MFVFFVVILFVFLDLPMAPKFPYLNCRKTVAKHHNTVCCDICNKWVHIACNNINTHLSETSKLQGFLALQQEIYAIQ